LGERVDLKEKTIMGIIPKHIIPCGVKKKKERPDCWKAITES